MNSAYITVKGICEEFNISSRTVYNMIRGEYRKNGKLHQYREPFPDPCGKVGGRLFFRIADIQRFFKENAQYHWVNGVYKKKRQTTILLNRKRPNWGDSF